MDLRLNELSIEWQMPLILAMHVLGLRGSEELQEWAAGALSETSPQELLDLVIGGDEDRDDCIIALLKKFAPDASPEWALGLYTQRACELICRGGVDPIEAACDISQLVFRTDVKDRADYDVFVYACDEACDRPEDAEAFAEAVRTEARLRRLNK